MILSAAKGYAQRSIPVIALTRDIKTALRIIPHCS